MAKHSYRIPLGPYAPQIGRPSLDPTTQDWAQGLSRPLSSPPADLQRLAESGGLFGATVNKITICNYISPAIVRAVEWVAALNPDHPHMYLTSCRDELVDKSIRTLKHYRTEGTIVIGIDGGYWKGKAGARALSDQGFIKGQPLNGLELLTHGQADSKEHGVIRQVVEMRGSGQGDRPVR